ncbi:MAG: HutD family protein [Proteocatella sp.]
MQYRIHRSGNFLTSRWSGGKTTQLAIYPENCDYANQDFIWRISSATVDGPESDFTKLPDYKRILVILEGEMTLSHEDGRQVTLKEFEQDAFDGEDSVKSFGKAKDFNLMYQKENEGMIEVLTLSDDAITIPLGGSEKYDNQFHCFYCIGERAEISYKIENIALKKGDLLEIRAVSQKKIELEIKGHGKLINASIYFNVNNRADLIDEAL